MKQMTMEKINCFIILSIKHLIYFFFFQIKKNLTILNLYLKFANQTYFYIVSREDAILLLFKRTTGTYDNLN